MRRAGKTLILCGLGTFLACGGAHANTPGPTQNPYEGIVRRNVFALKPPAPPHKPPPPKVDVPKITLTGITDILGRKQALLLAEEPGKGPHKKTEKKSYILVEGQRDGGIEVLQIDNDAGSVKVNNHGTIQTLNFEDNGLKLTKASALAAAHPQPHPPGLPQMGNHPRRLRHIPTQSLTSSSVPGTQPHRAGAGSSSLNNMSQGFVTVHTPRNYKQQSNLTRDQQAVLIEAERAKALDNGSPTAKLFPPTEFTKALMPQ